MCRLPPRSRGRARGFLILLIGLPLVGLVAVFVPRSMSSGGATPIYSVAALRATLDRQPTALLGRTLHVRGVAERCVMGRYGSAGAPCLSPGSTLADRADSGVRGSLPLDWAPPSWVRAHVGSVPILGSLFDDLAPPQTIHWGAPAVYRVEIVPAQPNGPNVEYEALLL